MMLVVCGWCGAPRSLVVGSECPRCYCELSEEQYQDILERRVRVYERFTDRARRVMQLANQEAQRLNHEYLSPVHILLGLSKEGSGVACHVLLRLGADTGKIREQVQKLVPPGPVLVNMGKMPQTPLAKRVIEHAIKEARNLTHNYVGTEHLLLGLLREQEGAAAQVMESLGLKLDRVRQEVLSLMGHGVTEGAARPDEKGWQTQLVLFFNTLARPGTRVTYWPGVREDAGRQGRTRSEAFLTPGGDACVLIEGHSGAIALSHVALCLGDLLPRQDGGKEDQDDPREGHAVSGGP